MKQQIEQLLDQGWIHPSLSPYGAPILFVCKKTGEIRMCIDYRSLNRQTRLDVFPIPRVANLFDRLGTKTVISSFDLSHAYHQVCIREGDESKTAFLTLQGLYEYLVIPIGLCNAPATFQRLMNLTFSDLIRCMTIYLDDILVFSSTVEQHMLDLHAVFEKLRVEKLFVKRKKCFFG